MSSSTDTCKFTAPVPSSLAQGGGAHTHDHNHDHTHDHPDPAHQHTLPRGFYELSREEQIAMHGHTHEHLDDAGKFSERDMPDYSGRNFTERGFTIGIGGCVSRLLPSYVRVASLNSFLFPSQAR